MRARVMFLVIVGIMAASILVARTIDVSISKRQYVLLYNASDEPEPSTPAPTKKDGPHVAYCFTGSMRTMPLVWHTIFTNVVEALQPDPDLRTVFFRVDTSGHCYANPVNVHHNQGFLGECQEQERVAAIDRDILFTNNSNFSSAFPNANVMSGSQSCDEDLFREHPCCTNPNAGGFSDQYWGFSQYARKQHCIDDIRNYSSHTGVNFSYVVLVRPDLYFFEPVPPVEHLLALHPRLLLSSKEQGASIGDYIFMFPWNLQTNVYNMIYDIFARRCSQPHAPDKGSSPEYIMEDYLANSKTVPHQIYPFAFAICRTETKADCFRMQHQYMGRAMFILETGPDGQSNVVNIFDYCNRKFPTRPVFH